MSAVWRWGLRHPTRVVAILAVILGWLAPVGVPDVVAAGLLTILGIVLGTSVHGAVTPIARVVDTTREAALDAAESTASRLVPGTVGQLGELTGHATGVAVQAASDATDAALRGLGVKRKDRPGR